MKKIKILSTKTLSNDLKHLFSDLKFDLYHNDFISIQPLILNLPKHDGSWIFTSKNAVEAVFSSNQNIDNFFNKIYCVGKNTKSLLVKKGQKIAKMAQNSSNLAEFISKTAKNEKFIFCRSNIKNEEFSDFFKKKNIELKELVAYNNVAKPKKYDQIFDAILFYSPSGIKSFMINNSLNNSYCVCIGQTTSKYAKRYSNKVLSCKVPTIENVISEKRLGCIQESQSATVICVGLKHDENEVVLDVLCCAETLELVRVPIRTSGEMVNKAIQPKSVLLVRAKLGGCLIHLCLDRDARAVQ